jgi:hypothetical protein
MGNRDRFFIASNMREDKQLQGTISKQFATGELERNAYHQKQKNSETLINL